MAIEFADLSKDQLDYLNYRKFLEKRRALSSDDLIVLAQNFNIDLDYLKKLRNEIRKKIGIEENKPAAVVTTFHLLLWELEYYRLAQKRIGYLNYENDKQIFLIPIGYMKARQEKAHLLNIGNRSFDFLKIFFNIDKLPETSYEFYFLLKKAFSNFIGEEIVDPHQLKEAVTKCLENEEFINLKIIPIRDKLKQHNILNLPTEEFHLTKEEINSIYLEIVKRTIYLIADFLTLFETFVKPDENWQKFLEIIGYLLEQKELQPIFEKLEINKEDFNTPENYGKLIFLLIILGGFDHIGAEWAREDQPGKYNLVRQSLNLPSLMEIPPQVFLERFSLDSELYLDSLTLRLLFPHLDSLLYSAAIEGPTTFSFSPLKSEARDYIRIIDFLTIYEKFFEKIKLGEIKFNQSLIKKFFEKYFEIIFKDKTNEDLKLYLKKFFEDKLDQEKEYELLSVIEEFNKNIINTDFKKYTIKFPLLMRIIAVEIFNNYIELSSEAVYDQEELMKKFLEIRKNINTIEDDLEQYKNFEIKFGGIKLPLELKKIFRSDFLALVIFFQNQLSKNNN